MHMWKNCFATNKLIFDVHGVALKRGWHDKEAGSRKQLLTRGVQKQFCCLICMYQPKIPSLPRVSKIWPCRRKKVFESHLTLLPLFFQLMYVQTPKRTDCFPNTLVTLSGKDPRWMDIPKNNRDSPTGWDNNLSALLFETTPVPDSSTLFLQWISVKDKFSCKLVETFILHFFFLSYRKKLLIKHFRKKKLPKLYCCRKFIVSTKLTSLRARKSAYYFLQAQHEVALVLG